jgi:hypothetical protein
VVGCTCASAAGELGPFRVGPVAAAAAVRRGGMACATKKVRQPPEARPCRLWADAEPGNFRPWSLSRIQTAPPRSRGMDKDIDEPHMTVGARW